MKTSDQNNQVIHPSNGQITREKMPQTKNDKKAGKKPIYIKDMPHIEVPIPGVI